MEKSSIQIDCADGEKGQSAIGEFIGAYPAYQATPTFAYTISDYSLDRQGVLTGPLNDNLLRFLAEDGYMTK